MSQVCGLLTVGEDKSTIFSSYTGPLPIHPFSHEFSLGMFRSDDLHQVQSSDEEHDAQDTLCLYKETMCENALEFGDTCVTIRMPTLTKRRILLSNCAPTVGAF